MAIDTDTPGSDGWWLLRLSQKLVRRQARLAVLDAWYRGDPPLPEGAENMREAYRAFQVKARTNYAELIVESTLQRMEPIGFRTAAAGDEFGDDEAMRIWDANGLPVESGEVHRSFLSMGDGYVIVGADEDDQPAVTAEDPRQVVTIHDPVRQRVVRAALKMFHDSERELDLAYLYLPGRVVVAGRSVKRNPLNPTVRFSPASYEWFPELGGVLPFRDQVPVVRFRNRRGVGEFEPHLDVLGRINHQVLQRMVIATLQAARQRAIKNAPLRYPDGTAIDYETIFSADPGALWALPKDAELWESGQVDLSPLLKAVEDDVRTLAAVTQTPLREMIPDSANQSAEGAAFAREGHVAKSKDRIKRATEGWRDVLSLAFRFAGDEERADRSRIVVLWEDPEHRSLAEKGSAWSQAADLPFEVRLQHIWGFPPREIRRIKELRDQEMAEQSEAEGDLGFGRDGLGQFS